MGDVVERVVKLAGALKELAETSKYMDEEGGFLVSLFGMKIAVAEGGTRCPMLIRIPINKGVYADKFVKWLDYAKQVSRYRELDRTVKEWREPSMVMVDELEVSGGEAIVRTRWIYVDEDGNEKVKRKVHQVMERFAVDLGELVLVASLLDDEALDDVAKRAKELKEELREVVEKVKEAVAAVKLIFER